MISVHKELISCLYSRLDSLRTASLNSAGNNATTEATSLPMGWSSELQDATIRSPDSENESVEVNSSMASYRLKIQNASLEVCEALWSGLVQGWQVILFVF